MAKERINCLKCKYFYITWEKQFSNGCKFFDFKSRYHPSLVVWQSSGKDCHAFTVKSMTGQDEQEGAGSRGIDRFRGRA